MKKLSKKGFTLTELIVVIVIIGILAAVLIPTLTGYIKKANKSADEQEVSMLNKITMLFDYDEERPSSVPELKKLLKEEGYNGNYSLRVEGDYLWYDVKENRFVIINEEDIPTSSADLLNLSLVDISNYKLTSNLSSPEGLLNNGESEVWLIGGNGELVDVVYTLRNLADDELVADKIEALKDAFKVFDEYNLKDAMVYFINNSKFYAGKNTYGYTMSNDGTIVENSISELVDRDFIYSDIYEAPKNINDKLNFHNELLYGIFNPDDPVENQYTNLELVNSFIKDIAIIKINDNINNDGSFDVEIQIIDGNSKVVQCTQAFAALLQILSIKNTTAGSIIPMINDEVVAKADFMGYLEKINNDVIPEIKLDNESLSDPELYTTFASLIISAANYNPNYDSEEVVVPEVSGSLALSTLLNTNEFKITGYVSDPELGDFEVYYNFKFIEYEINE